MRLPVVCGNECHKPEIFYFFFFLNILRDTSCTINICTGPKQPYPRLFSVQLAKRHRNGLEELQ